MASSVTGRVSVGDDLRLRGVRGGIIQKHRAMVGLEWKATRVLRALLLSLIFGIGLIALLPWIGRAYTYVYEELIWWIGLPSGVGVETIRVGSLLTIPIPFFRLDAPWPSRDHWILVASITAIALLASFLLPVRYLPARYFIRFVALIQTVSLGYFWFSDPPFQYPLPGYTAGMLAAGMAVLTLVPIVLGFAFYIFDHNLARQLLLTVFLLAHLTVLLPLQVLTHAWLSHYFSVLVQPTMFFVFGLLIEVLVFVAFYGWAMSWPGTEIPQTPSAGPTLANPAAGGSP